jgi:hypothetical protein
LNHKLRSCFCSLLWCWFTNLNFTRKTTFYTLLNSWRIISENIRRRICQQLSGQLPTWVKKFI